MNASEARILTMGAKHRSWDDEDKTCMEIVKNISEKIQDAAMEGKSKTVIDLRDKSLHPKINQFLKRLQNSLELDGFYVETKLTRTPNGAREMLITW